MNLDQLCAEAMKRLQFYINRSAAQHLRYWRETHMQHQDGK